MPLLACERSELNARSFSRPPRSREAGSSSAVSASAALLARNASRLALSPTVPPSCQPRADRNRRLRDGRLPPAQRAKRVVRGDGEGFGWVCKLDGCWWRRAIRLVNSSALTLVNVGEIGQGAAGEGAGGDGRGGGVAGRGAVAVGPGCTQLALGKTGGSSNRQAVRWQLQRAIAAIQGEADHSVDALETQARSSMKVRLRGTVAEAAAAVAAAAAPAAVAAAELRRRPCGRLEAGPPC